MDGFDSCFEVELSAGGLKWGFEDNFKYLILYILEEPDVCVGENGKWCSIFHARTDQEIVDR